MSTDNWKEILSSLCSSSSDKQKKCFIRVLDTIFFEANKEKSPAASLLWYFTTKSGSVAKKKEENSYDVNSIPDRFSRFALANPNNKENIIGTFFHSNGFRQYLKADALQDLLTNNVEVTDPL